MLLHMNIMVTKKSKTSNRYTKKKKKSKYNTKDSHQMNREICIKDVRGIAWWSSG